MKHKRMTGLLFCFLLIFSGMTIVEGKGNPIKPKMRKATATPNKEFVCGVYKGNEKELFWHYYQHKAAMKKLQKSGARSASRSFVFDDVWIAEDDGSILIAGVNPFDTDHQTFRFQPNANEGYDVTSVALSFDSNFGNNLNLEDDTNATVNIPFTFKYYGGSRTDVHVNANGIVSFGGDINPSGFFDDADFFSTLPKIAAYFVDLNPAENTIPPAGGVFAKSESSKLTITWNQVPEFGTADFNTIQLVLRDDASFDVTFNGIATLTQVSNNTPIAFGIHPGGMPNLEIISFSDDVPFTGSAGAGIFENYLDIQNPIVNEGGLFDRFYQSFPDSFFQIIFFTNFTQTMAGFANELTIKNGIEGIGVASLDFSEFFGTAKLESRANMNRLGVWPSDPEFRFFGDGNNFLTIMGQEAGHRWGAFVNFIDANGDTSNLILGRADAHWSFYFDSDHSSLEGGNWEPVSGNSFTTPTQIDFYSDIDEYLLGLRRPEEVTPSFFVSSFSNNFPNSRAKGTPPKGTKATGTAIEVIIEDIIAAEGPRIPAEPDAPKDLRQAFVLITRNGTTPTQAELDKIANFRRTWEDYFERSVDGRMTLNTSITRTFPVAVIKGQVLDATSSEPITNFTVESRERGFEQFVAGGGRYTFRYLADANSGTSESITIIADASGYFADTLVTSIAYGTEAEVNIELQPNTTSVEETESRPPTSFGLEQNYPNPFNPTTTIQIKLPEQSVVTLDIYNLNGQLVRTLAHENLPAGNHSFVWDGRNERGNQVPSGLYVSRLKAGLFTQHRKMLLIR